MVMRAALLRGVGLGCFALALAACGSHQSAPIVYGADAGHTARIYNSREEIYRKQRLERAQQAYRPEATRAVASNVDTVTLTPVSEIRLDQPVEPAPAKRRKAKGYIEVQPGDTVYAISRRFDVAPRELIAANDLNAPYTLSVGQALKLPRGASVVTAAPAATRQVVARDTLYTVRKGDTLYSISRASKVPTDTIADANRLRAPYNLAVGQSLVIPQAPVGQMRSVQTRTANAQPAVRNTNKPQADNVSELARQVSYTAPEPSASSSKFGWPVRGAIISEYGMGELGRRNDGVNIAAPAGTPVRAAAAGEVVYRGSELDGFGNLLLVKHAGGYVTAYAHNDAMLVRKGDQVRQGQVIAKVGQTGDVTTPQLHFEIRRELKAVDPLALLGSQ